MPRKSGKRDARIQTGLRLEPEVLDQLRKSSLGVSEEIRRRIDLTLAADVYDEPTRELAADIMAIAHEISQQAGLGSSWHNNRKANEALAAALQTWLEGLKPMPSGGVSDLFGPDDPATLGRTIARSYRGYKSALARNTAELLNNVRKGDKS